jgi:hypothetical protein
MRRRPRPQPPRRDRPAIPPTPTDGVIVLPPPVTASRLSLAAIATTHDRVRAILGSHLWKLGFVTEAIEVPTEATPEPDAEWDVRVVARRRALRARGAGRRRRRGSGERVQLDVACRVRRRPFGRLHVHYRLPPMQRLAPVHRLPPQRTHG